MTMIVMYRLLCIRRYRIDRVGVRK